jgi:hypothetical protein
MFILNSLLFENNYTAEYVTLVMRYRSFKNKLHAAYPLNLE